MSEVDDISGLYKHIGTTPDQYKEIGLENEARESEARWPLLGAIHARIRQSYDLPAPAPSQARVVQPDSLRFSEPVVVQNDTGFGDFMPEPAPLAGLDADENLAQSHPPAGRKAEFIPPNPIALAAFGAGDRTYTHDSTDATPVTREVTENTQTYSAAAVGNAAVAVPTQTSAPAAHVVTDSTLGHIAPPSHASPMTPTPIILTQAPRANEAAPIVEQNAKPLSALLAHLAGEVCPAEEVRDANAPKKNPLFDRLVRP